MRAAIIASMLMCAAAALGADAPPSFDAAKADLQARATFARETVNQAEKIAATQPATSRPVLRARDGSLAPDVRPTPGRAAAVARMHVGKLDGIVREALKRLESVKDDPDLFGRQLPLARLQVNEVVELVLAALEEGDFKVQAPAWLGPPAKPADAVLGKKLDALLSDAVWNAWEIDHPDKTGGIGTVGVGGRESVQTFAAGQKIGTLAEVLSQRVTFRVNAKLGAKAVTPTTPNFTLKLLRSQELDKEKLPQDTLLSRRAAMWWHRTMPPNISAATGK